MSVSWLLDMREWPLATLEIPRGTLTGDIDQESFYAAFETLIARKEPHVLLVRSAFDGGFNAVDRARYRAWYEQRAKDFRKVNIATATVTLTTAARGFSTAANWSRTTSSSSADQAASPDPTRAKQRMFSNEEDARAWLKEMLMHEGKARRST